MDTTEFKNEYPKVMMVGDDGKNWKQRVVFMKKRGQYLAWTLAETIEEAAIEMDTVTWKYAKEIEHPKQPEVTTMKKGDAIKLNVADYKELTIKTDNDNIQITLK